jgi:hypothetical protein
MVDRSVLGGITVDQAVVMLLKLRGDIRVAVFAGNA